jgi:hypothetical protein
VGHLQGASSWPSHQAFIPSNHGSSRPS